MFLLSRTVNLLTICEGMGLGWAGPSINLLTSDESPLPSGQLTMEEASWIVSFLCVGGLIGNILFGFIANKFGRKRPLLVIAIPIFVRNGPNHWTIKLQRARVKCQILFSFFFR